MLYKILRAIANVIIRPFFRIEVIGEENIPTDPGYILCANHKSNWDPILVAMAFKDNISFMAKKELFDNAILGGLLKKAGVFPVDRKGRDLKSLKNSIKLLKEGQILGVFPEGTRTVTIDRSNMKDGVAYIALKAKKDVLPVEIISSYKILKKTYIYINEPIRVDKYLSMKSKEAMLSMSDEIFENIYKRQLG